MIRLEEGTTRRVRVIGSLRGPALRLLAPAVSRGPLVLDLSEVDQADESGVRLLAGLPPERCTLAGCPTWLSIWIDRALEATYRLSVARHEAGLDGYLGVLVAQRALFAGQQALVGVRLAEQANVVTLYKALGGGA